MGESLVPDAALIDALRKLIAYTESHGFSEARFELIRQLAKVAHHTERTSPTYKLNRALRFCNRAEFN
jgi:hypothetical protein